MTIEDRFRSGVPWSWERWAAISGKSPTISPEILSSIPSNGTLGQQEEIELPLSRSEYITFVWLLHLKSQKDHDKVQDPKRHSETLYTKRVYRVW